MTPQKQTVLYGPHAIGNGNCFAACLASLLDLPIWMVPPFEQMFGRDDWRVRVNEWLSRFFSLKMVHESGHDTTVLPKFYIASGRSLRGVYHSTIYSEGRLVHDPHFSDDGICSVEWTWHLEPIDLPKV